MRITKVDAFAIKMPQREIDTSQVNPTQHGDYYIAADTFTAIFTRRRETTLVRIESDSGAVGWGETQAPVASRTVKTIVDDLCKPLLIDADPFDVRFLWYRLYSAMRERGHVTGFYIDALAGVDIALYDLLGRALGVPVYNLLGGRFRKQVAVYDSGTGGETVEPVVKEAGRLASKGYRGLKLHLRVPDRMVCDMVRGIREKVGEDIEVMVDIHTERDVSGGIALGRKLEPLGVRWLETPTAPEDVAGNAEISRALDMQVAGGEWLRTSYEWRQYIEARAFDVAMPDIGRTGLSEGMRIAAICDTYNVPVAPHIGNGMGIITAASVHLSAAIPNFQILEHTDYLYPENTSFLRVYPELDASAFPLHDRPGLGVEVDEEKVRGLAGG